MSRRHGALSRIGNWSEIKLAIIREYAQAYSCILSAQTRPRLAHVYIDAFSGAGFHATRKSGDLVWGSPAIALLTDPPFKEYHFIDLDRGNIQTLSKMAQTRTQGPYDPETVFCYNGDCNEILGSEVFPRARYEDYRRALCLLDPYGLHLDWSVVAAAGAMKSIEIIVNFPIADINRNVLHRDRSKVQPSQRDRLRRFWGDDSWEETAYSRAGNLFGYEEKTTNADLVSAFRGRLKKEAGFSFVPRPIPMRNSRNADLYYLFFASQKPAAEKIIKSIFDKYRAQDYT